MAIHTKKEGNTAVVSMSGRLDSVTGPEYRKAMLEVVDGGTVRVVVDFHQVNYISSAGVGELLVSLKLLQGKGGQLCLAGVQPNILSVLKMCGIDGLLPMRASVEDALAAVA